MTNSVISGNHANIGGGIANSGALLLTNSMVNSNDASNSGGGIANTGSMSVTNNSIVSQNSASGTGGGIKNTASGVNAMTLDSSSVITNTSAFSGGGIDNSGTLTIRNATVAANRTNNGFAFAPSAGGGINNSGSLGLQSSLVTGNAANGAPSGSGPFGDGYGGGINNSGASTVVDTTITGNLANGGPGGGIYNNGSITMTGSVVGANTANTNFGGGIRNDGLLTVVTSTIDGNAAPQFAGGGIDNRGPLTMADSTVSGNIAGVERSGVGIYNFGGGSRASISYSTVDSVNSVGSGSALSNNGGTIALTGTIVAGGCSGAIGEGAGYNLDDGTSCRFSQTTDITNTDPQLGPLADNGGPTLPNGSHPLTRALTPGSAAIDAGQAACTDAQGNPLTTDQRGAQRPFPTGGRCDMGAYEAQFAPATVWYVDQTIGSDANDCIAATNNGGGDGPCLTIDAAYHKARSGGTIDVASGVYTPTAPLAKDLTINGTGQDQTFIDGQNNGTVVTVDPAATVAILGVLIQRGYVSSDTQGGAGINNAGTLTLTNSTVFSSTATGQRVTAPAVGSRTAKEP